MNKKLSLKIFDGKKILITGATGNLGTSFSKHFSELGADLILLDKSEKSLKKLKDEISKNSSNNISTFLCNLEKEEERILVFKKIKTKFKGLDCLINNAAFVGEHKLKGWNVPFNKQSIDTWRRAMEVNLTAPFHLSQLFAPMLKKNKGNIINISSIYGEFAPDWTIYKNTKMENPVAYSVSKGGLNQLTKYLAKVLAPHIRVNAISPGGIYRNQEKIFIKKYKMKVPLKRMAVESDLNGAAVYLASNLSDYVTGQIIRVDGGWGI